MRIVFLAVALLSVQGCFLDHSPSAGEAPDARSPGAIDAGVPGRAVDAGRAIDPSPVDHDICPTRAPVDLECDCGHERLPHPDEEGRCFVCRPCDSHCGVPVDDSLANEAHFSWQGPGGFAGTGPAIVATGDGMVRVWGNTPVFPPDASPLEPPDRLVYVGPRLVAQLLARFAAVDLTDLPREGPRADCYATVFMRACEGCAESTLTYPLPELVMPELGCVAAWFEAHLPDIDAAQPARYCEP